MLSNGGKYEAECTQVRESAEAASTVVIICGGNRGDGFSVQATAETLLRLPSILESMAAQIRADVAAQIEKGGH